MTIDELVTEGVLEKVDVGRLVGEVKAAGDQKSRCVFGNRMSGNTCAGNSLCVAEAMADQGEDDWQVVLGYAVNGDGEGPISHVWVRKGHQHYDPTWPIWDTWREDLPYYQLLQDLDIQPHLDSDIRKAERVLLNALDEYASKRGLRLFSWLTDDDDA